MVPANATPEELASAESEFQQGVSLIATDTEQAVQLIGKVLEFRNSVHGELAEECAETYLWYARALLEQARASSDPLGQTAQPAAPGAGTSSAEPAAAAAEAVPAPGASDVTAQEQAPAEPDKASDKETPADAQVKPADEGAPEEGAAADGGDEGQSEEEGEEEEEDGEEEGAQEGGEEEGNESDDLRLAWDMLELARVICSKSTNPKLVPVQASVHLSLGDVSAEKDEFDIALAEYAKCQALLEGMENKDKRALAGVHFTTMLALTMVDDLPQAHNHCKQAMALLEACRTEVIKAMDTPVTGETGAEADEAIDKLDKELDEIESSLKDLKERLEDMEAAMKEQAELKAALKGAMQSMVAQQVKASTSQAPAAAGSAPAAAEATGRTDPFSARAPVAEGSRAAPTAVVAVQNLGVAGRGRKRITLQPCQPTAAAPGSPKLLKRPLEEASGGAPQEENGGAAKKPAIEVQPASENNV